jgi:hypothetical protein
MTIDLNREEEGGTMGGAYLFSHMTKILASSNFRVWWLPVMGFALPLSLS